MRARAWGPLCASLLLLAAPALAFRVPEPQGYVTDVAGALTPTERSDLDGRLRAYDQRTGNQVVVFIPASLEDEPREDVAYQVFQNWRIGAKGKDNGVLLLWAPKERQVYIQTGKGVGGALTDLQASRIIRELMRPLLQANRNAEALQVGTDAIMKALDADSSGIVPPPAQGPVQLPRFFDLCFWGFIGFVVLVLLLRASRRPRRRTYWGGGPFIGGGGWGGGGGFGGGGGGDWGGGGGGGGFSGGGGETGGGGAGDSY